MISEWIFLLIVLVLAIGAMLANPRSAKEIFISAVALITRKRDKKNDTRTDDGDFPD